MLASIHSGSATKVWPEIWRESEKRRSVLFIFPGGRLSSQDEYEYMRNGAFDLVKRGNFDGVLCWASSLSGFASESEVERYLESNLTMPMVTFGLKIGGHPVVHIDAYSGMQELIFHLLKKHGCRRIAYLGGPRAHSSAEDRFRAYCDALKTQGIGWDEKLTVLDNPWTEGRRAMEILLDERKLRPGRDFDALCSASDLLSFEAAALLRERGFAIPGDIALGGFNDSDESNLLSPTFTTVHMPFERQAVQALRMLLELLSGKDPRDKMLKTSLVVRQSCGCSTKAVQMAAGRKSPAKQPGSGSDSRSNAHSDDKTGLQSIDRAELLRAALKAVGASSEEGADQMESLIGALLERIGGKTESPFLENMGKLLDDAIAQERELGVFQNLLSILRKSLEPYAADPIRNSLLESLIGQGRVLVSEAEKRLSTYRIWQERKLDHWLSILSHELLCTKDFDGIVNIAAHCLPPLGIKEAYFVLNGEDSLRRIFLGGFKPRAGKSVSIRLYHGRGGNRTFPSENLLPEELFPREPGTFAVLPLYFESTSLGYAILSVGRKDAYVYEEIRTQLSSALRGVLLFEQANRARIRAEKAERMKSQFLAGISGELQEPLGRIHQKALELLSQEDVKPGDALREIVTSSSQQLELTKNLLEFSQAQVEDLPLNSRLLKPRQILQDLISIAAENISHREWGHVGLVSTNSAALDELPLIWGDRARLHRGMEIFIDYLFRELESQEVLLDASLEEHRLRISATARRLGGEPGRKALAQLHSIMETDTDGASPGSSNISLELAKRIALLHGALPEFEESGEFLSLSILLPYPSLESFSRIDSQAGEILGIGVLGGAEPELLRGLYPETPRLRLGISEAASADTLAKRLGILYIDPENATTEEAAAARLLLDEGALRNLGCIVPGRIADSPVFEEGESLGAVLRRFFPASNSPAVIVAGAQVPVLEELERDLGAGAEGMRVLSCHGPEELALVAEREKAALVLSSSGEPVFLSTILETSSLATLPLLWLLEKPEDTSLSVLLLERPRTLVCNAGKGFADLRANLCKEIQSGSKVLLPAPTGAIVIKAIAFLNKHFREHISRWRLSDELNASEDYLSRIFRTQMGITLWDYLNRLRIAYAVELLSGSSETVAEVAAKAGFQDQAYFCRVFKRIQGTTPGALRKETQHDVRKVQ